MLRSDLSFVSVDPVMLPRLCGGWLARSQDSAAIRIGVTALSEAGAREDFMARMDRWMVWLSDKAEDVT